MSHRIMRSMVNGSGDSHYAPCMVNVDVRFSSDSNVLFQFTDVVANLNDTSWSFEDFEKFLINKASESGYKFFIATVPGDGNCFWHAVLTQLGLRQEEYIKLKRLVLNTKIVWCYENDFPIVPADFSHTNLAKLLDALLDECVAQCGKLKS